MCPVCKWVNCPCNDKHDETMNKIWININLSISICCDEEFSVPLHCYYVAFVNYTELLMFHSQMTENMIITLITK